MAKKQITLKSEVSKCNSKKRALIVVEGVTDKKLYDYIIENKITRDKDKYTIKCVEDFEEINSGGCSQIINLLEFNKSYIQSQKSIKKILLAFIDGDANDYRKKSFDISEFSDIVHKLNYYSIESYSFGENCLEKVLGIFLVAMPQEIREILSILYNNIINNTINIAFNLAILCILNDIGIIKSELKYGISEGIFTSGDLIYKKIDEESEIYKNQINEYVKEKSLKCNIETVKIITKGKHLNYLIAKEIHKQISLLSKEKACKIFEYKELFEEICCTSLYECTKNKCIFSLENLHGNSINKYENVTILYLLIKEYIFLSNCEEIVTALKAII